MQTHSSTSPAGGLARCRATPELKQVMAAPASMSLCKAAGHPSSVKQQNFGLLLLLQITLDCSLHAQVLPVCTALVNYCNAYPWIPLLCSFAFTVCQATQVGPTLAATGRNLNVRLPVTTLVCCIASDPSDQASLFTRP